ncbi:hypothetical protein [Streptomyces sp. enrichment culture]|uniref:hypothetical protein n=1 Tax=Streptomyces sp. enrichment culture TaxID=1795815 RepID=UPI003F5574C1
MLDRAERAGVDSPAHRGGEFAAPHGTRRAALERQCPYDVGESGDVAVPRVAFQGARSARVVLPVPRSPVSSNGARTSASSAARSTARRQGTDRPAGTTVARPALRTDPPGTGSSSATAPTTAP